MTLSDDLRLPSFRPKTQYETLADTVKIRSKSQKFHLPEEWKGASRKILSLHIGAAADPGSFLPPESMESTVQTDNVNSR
jgi:hypothetical protein